MIRMEKDPSTNDDEFNGYSIYSGGRVSRHIGHCRRYFIQPSKQVAWKICRQGVTMYIRLANKPAGPLRCSPDDPLSITATSNSCIQIAQSYIRLPFSLVSLIDIDARRDESLRSRPATGDDGVASDTGAGADA